jgi:putative membrane protein
MCIHGRKMDLLVGSLLLRPYVFLFLAAFIAAATRDLGLRRALAFTAVVWPLAWAAEFASIHVGVPFGLYHYTGLTRGQELYIAGVPFFDSLSFTFLAYAASCLARRVLAGLPVPAGTTALLSGFLMMMLDVVIDPVAVRGERWFLGHVFYYPQGGVYFGVPLSNFAGWWLVGSAGVALVEAVAGAGAPHRAGRTAGGIALYYAVVSFNVAVTAWIGEWRLLVAGLGLHGVMAVALAATVRRTWQPVLTTRRVERA